VHCSRHSRCKMHKPSMASSPMAIPSQSLWAFLIFLAGAVLCCDPPTFSPHEFIGFHPTHPRLHGPIVQACTPFFPPRFWTRLPVAEEPIRNLSPGRPDGPGRNPPPPDCCFRWVLYSRPGRLRNSVLNSPSLPIAGTHGPSVRRSIWLAQTSQASYQPLFK